MTGLLVLLLIKGNVDKILSAALQEIEKQAVGKTERRFPQVLHNQLPAKFLAALHKPRENLCDLHPVSPINHGPLLVVGI